MSAVLHAVGPFFIVFSLYIKLLPPCCDYYSSGDCCVLWYIISPLNSYHGPLLDGASKQHQVSMMWFCHHHLEVLLAPRHSGGVVDLDMGPPQVGFSFRVEPPTILYFYMFGVCSSVCFLLSSAMLDAIFTYWGSTIGVCTIATL